MTGWTIPAKSFDGTTLVASVGGSFQHGDIIDLNEVLTEHACEVVVTATSGAFVEVRLEGSLDGENFYMIGSGSLSAPADGTFGYLISASGSAAQYIRADGYGDNSDPVATTYHTSGPA